MCLMLCETLDWQYAELTSSASDAVLCSVLVRGTSKQIEKKKKKPSGPEAEVSAFIADINF